MTGCLGYVQGTKPATQTRQDKGMISRAFVPKYPQKCVSRNSDLPQKSLVDIVGTL